MYGLQTFLNGSDQQLSENMLHLWIYAEGELSASTTNYPGYLIDLPYEQSFVMTSGSKAIVYYPSKTQAYIFAPLGCYYRIISFTNPPDTESGNGLRLYSSDGDLIFDSAYNIVSIDYSATIDYTVTDFPVAGFSVSGLPIPPLGRRRYIAADFFEPFRSGRNCQPCLYSVSATSYTMDFSGSYLGPLGWIGVSDWMDFPSKLYILSGY